MPLTVLCGPCQGLQCAFPAWPPFLLMESREPCPSQQNRGKSSLNKLERQVMARSSPRPAGQEHPRMAGKLYPPVQESLRIAISKKRSNLTLGLDLSVQLMGKARFVLKRQNARGPFLGRRIGPRQSSLWGQKGFCFRQGFRFKQAGFSVKPPAPRRGIFLFADYLTTRFNSRPGTNTVFTICLSPIRA